MGERVLNIFVGCLVMALLIAGLPIGTEAASPGALDGTFSTDGRVTTNILANDDASDVVVQPDGKIVVVGGRDTISATADFVVIRYNPDGSLDTTFDTDGVFTFNFGALDIAYGVALQADGKIVVVGKSGADFAAARVNPNGSLDNTFDGDGRATTDFNAGNDVAESVVIQEDGKIVAGGEASVAGNSDFGLVRYNTNGSLDTTFSGDGKANYDISGLPNFAADLLVQPDGKIVAAGEVSIGLLSPAKDGPNASVDAITNRDNNTNLEVRARESGTRSQKAVPEGGNFDFAIIRINAVGALDTTFDTDGIVITDFGSGDGVTGLALQPDGKIIAGGISLPDAALARYNTTGSLDTTFDGDGRVFVNLNPTGFEQIRDIKLQGGGKIAAVLSGTDGGFLGISAARFNTNGSVDSSFGNNGFVTTTTNQPSQFCNAAAISGDNLIVVGDADDIFVAQFNLTIQPTESNDFDGDGFSDSAVFRPSAGYFFVLRSSNSIVDFIPFGIPGDIPVDGDFDGDGKTDVGIYRPSVGQWWIQRSTAGLSVSNFGQSSDKPVVGDYDKDGKSDVAFWRPSNGHYYVLTSSSNFSNFFAYPFGLNGDLPVGATIAP